jgi:hypothetical protein
MVRDPELVGLGNNDEEGNQSDDYYTHFSSSVYMNNWKFNNKVLDDFLGREPDKSIRTRFYIERLLNFAMGATESPLRVSIKNLSTLTLNDIVNFAKGEKLRFNLPYTSIRSYSGDLAQSFTLEEPNKTNLHFSIVTTSDYYRYVSEGAPDYSTWPADKVVRIPIQYAMTATEKEQTNGYIYRRISQYRRSVGREKKPFVQDIMKSIWEEKKDDITGKIKETVTMFMNLNRT